MRKSRGQQKVAANISADRDFLAGPEEMKDGRSLG
jgi:hypothetical protein